MGLGHDASLLGRRGVEDGICICVVHHGHLGGGGQQWAGTQGLRDAVNYVHNGLCMPLLLCNDRGVDWSAEE